MRRMLYVYFVLWVSMKMFITFSDLKVGTACENQSFGSGFYVTEFRICY